MRVRITFGVSPWLDATSPSHDPGRLYPLDFGLSVAPARVGLQDHRNYTAVAVSVSGKPSNYSEVAMILGVGPRTAASLTDWGPPAPRSRRIADPLTRVQQQDGGTGIARVQLQDGGTGIGGNVHM
jgi:hypothetical protein